jgi:diacylglycerol kinase family enzyme
MGESVIIVNPNAQGGRIRRHIESIRETAAAHDAANATRDQIRVVVSDGIAHANSFLRTLSRESRVIVAGGDGTVQPLLAALVEKEHRLGVLPLGSGNDGARALGTYGNASAGRRGHWRDTLSQLLRSQTVRTVDLGVARFDDREVLFLVALNAGFDAAIAHRAVIGPKFLHGLPRYLLATCRELLSLEHWALTIERDGEPLHRGQTLFASTLNAPTYGSGMPAVPHAKCDDGAFNLLVARNFSKLGALLMLPRLLRGTHLSDSRVSTHAFRALTLTSEHPIPLAADGEFLGTAQRVAIQVNAQSIRAIDL